MTIMHASHHTDVSTVNYSSLYTQQKLHHCVMDVRRQYPIAPLFQGDLAHAQTVCTRLSLCDPQNVSGGDHAGNEATAVGSNEGRATGSSVELTDTTGPDVVVVCGLVASELVWTCGI